FEYNYSLCKGIENNIDFINKTSGLENTEGGKLTLKKVYFTYRDSNMGKYTPYTFNYDELNESSNPNYNQKNYDIWGNYKKSNEGVGCETLSALSNAEYPYVDQSNQVSADQNASVWLLRSIGLPSGGEMELKYESDDYKYVQNKEAMQMFKVVGAGNEDNPNDLSDQIDNKNLSNLSNPIDMSYDYLYIKLDKPCSNEEFYDKYIRKLKGLPIYFRFLTNMTSPFVSDNDKYDYVTGYLNLSNEAGVHKIIGGTNGLYAAVKIAHTTRGDGGALSGIPVSPITKAGWYFGRQYLNNTVYSHTGREDVNIEDVEGVVKSLVGMITDLKDIVISPNQKLIQLKIASKFIANKSWIRLMQPESKKLGGGVRVKEIKIHDNWDRMTNNEGQEVYKQFYGQQYSYVDKDGNGSSGVASYEPLGCKENPFVYPFYDHNKPDSVLGPGTQNYVELPFGECFFPSPKITYSHVSVKNLAREKTNANEVITLKKHATGDVVTDFFTTRDYPTISDISMISAKYDNSPLAGLLNINVKTHLTMAQGFSIHTNDMDGKMKSQEVYSEGKELVSGMEYKYEEMPNNSSSNQGKLNNEIVTIDSKGVIGKNTVAVDYDVVNDFRENYSETKSAGLHFQTETLPITLLILVVPCPIPRFAKHVNILRTAITTKVIHTTGILRETIAFDKNAKVSTKNLAWDADTGNVLLTETINEYNDKYYNFNFPAYWANPGMSQAALNLGLTWNIKNISGQNKYQFDSVNSVNPNADDYLIDGDEVWATPSLPSEKRGVGFKAWVVNVKPDHSFNLIDEKGIKVVQQTDDVKNPNAKVIASGSIKVIKSGHKNMQGASMASVTLMKKPSLTIGSNIGNDPFLSNDWSSNRIVNASAIEYKDVWPSQCECGLPQMKFKVDNPETLIDESKELLPFQYDLNNSSLDFDIVEKKSYNPYRYNVLGNWRAVKSHAYLTGRNNTADPTPRKTGFFNDFRSFYVHNSANENWTVTTGEARGRWTFASEVSQYNAWGQEVENKDALERYSSALYGYNNRFPVAVASNTKYKELAYDGFEDYDFADCNEKSHFSYEGALVKNKISITNKQSHTGRRSIRLEPKATSTIQKKIVNCTPKVTVKTNTKIVAKK
ncbi:hypothetical protein, partial [Flavobacterium sp.]|uniref:hypothetical protein n=1 Tax=Flavobacterium sp. TaxID=239 RepID=UPI0038FD1755